MSGPSNYSQWILDHMEINKQERIAIRVQGILAIHALHLPHDITLQLIISYKYDLKIPTYKRYYNTVIYQLQKQHRRRRTRKTDSGEAPMSYWPHQPAQAQPVCSSLHS